MSKKQRAQSYNFEEPNSANSLKEFISNIFSEPPDKSPGWPMP
jgi:hypothetical protein